jgi:hypothetical protein
MAADRIVGHRNNKCGDCERSGREGGQICPRLEQFCGQLWDAGAEICCPDRTYPLAPLQVAQFCATMLDARKRQRPPAPSRRLGS